LRQHPSRLAVVKDISHKTIRYDLGIMSISVDKLIEILEAKNFEKVTATNKNIEFENLDDIKSHKALFSGDPTIYADKLTLTFSRVGNSISPYGREPEIYTSAKSLSEELIKHKTLFDRFSEIKLLRNIFIFPLTVIFYLFSEYHSKLGISDTAAKYTGAVYLVYLLLFAVSSTWSFYTFALRPRVYYAPAQGFFKRNMETIAVSTITGIIGLALGAVFTVLSAKMQAWF
jgi:hypothetical protein